MDQVLHVMIDQDTSSSDDDDLDILFLDLAFAPKRNLGVRISLQDISKEDCEWLIIMHEHVYIYESYKTK